MPRVRERDDDRGCRVTGQLFDSRSGVHVTVTLERPCTWHGHLVPTRFEATTDFQGRFEMWLPPTSQMTARDAGETPLYQFTAEQIGSWLFAVPAQETWSLADG